MARTKLPWLRLYTETPTDRKIRRLDPAHRWLWIVVLCAARMSPKPGALLVDEGDPMDIRDIADLADLHPKTTRSGMSALVKAGLLEVDLDGDYWKVTRWDDRQFKSDDAGARSQQWRAKR